MNKFISILFLAFISFKSISQSNKLIPDANPALQSWLNNIRANPKISADSTFTLLTNWNYYPALEGKNHFLLYIYNDPFFGVIPLQVYIPQQYKSNSPMPLVLLLHGAVVLSSFKDAYKDTLSDEDLFYHFFEQQNFILVRPFADSKGPNTDGTKLFDWVVNHFNGIKFRNKTNPTYAALTGIVNKLKEVVNIDDNKVFAFGHSDGSDGTFALEVYKPSLFAGFVVYNSMLNNIFTHDIYLRNTLNRPLYLVHSDLDDLRPIQQTREQVKILDSLKSPVTYKEYIGYKHFDTHLQKDLPFMYTWIKTIKRNPFQHALQWETSDTSNSLCDWLRVTQIDTSLSAQPWHTELDMKTYNKRNGQYYDFPYYDSNKSGLAKASFHSNTFNIETSRVKEIELYISPLMVNLQHPVTVVVNGKVVFQQKLTADKNFMLDKFSKSYDRTAIWVTSLRLSIKN